MTTIDDAGSLAVSDPETLSAERTEVFLSTGSVATLGDRP
jgi:hypothetical protein